jgi:hypothetical protein
VGGKFEGGGALVSPCSGELGGSGAPPHQSKPPYHQRSNLFSTALTALRFRKRNPPNRLPPSARTRIVSTVIMLAGKKKAPRTHSSHGTLLNSPPPELLTDSLDALLKAVNGTAVLISRTNGLRGCL